MNFKIPVSSKLIILCFTMLLSISCENKKENKKDIPFENENLEDSIQNIEEKMEPPLVINYKIDSLKTSVELDSFRNNYSEAHQNIIFALNRIEARKVRKGKNLVIPDTLFDDLLKYAPFPKTLDFISDIPKTVLISQRVQAFGLYENGKLIKWGPVSSGKKSTPTPNGLHYGNYKAKRKISSVNDAWILPYYFNFMNFEGVGVHEYSLPGYPASHACVRLYEEDALYIYDWAKQWELTPNGKYVHKNGTPFMVFGEYDYKSPEPWLQLAENMNSNELLDSELEILKEFKVAYDSDEKNVAEVLEKEEGIENNQDLNSNSK